VSACGKVHSNLFHWVKKSLPSAHVPIGRHTLSVVCPNSER
jgi:hypothetical protein